MIGIPKTRNVRRWSVAVAMVAAGFGLAGCEGPREGSGADDLRDGVRGYDSEPNVDCEVFFCDE
jgi:hypothetical protein